MKNHFVNVKQLVIMLLNTIFQEGKQKQLQKQMSMQQNQNQKTENRIYFQEVPLKQSIQFNTHLQEQNPTHSIQQFTPEELHHIHHLQEEFNKFYALFNDIKNASILNDDTVEIFCKSLGEYVLYIVKYQNEEVFFQYFLIIKRHSVQNKFVALLLEKIYHFKFQSDIVKKIFESLQFLLRGIKKQDQFVYFLVSLNKEGFLTTKYQFQQDDSPYFANFIKLLVRKINEDEKYLNIFFNLKEPHFPLLMNLLKMHDEKDMILKTSVKLTLIEITSNQSKLIKSFTNNFPFVIFYPIYVYQIYHSFLDSISDDSLKQQTGKQNLKTTLKFMQDFIQTKQKQSIEMYANCFMSLIGKFIYKQFSQFNHKHPEKIIRILKLLYEIVAKDINVLKIKIGMGQFFTKTIGKNLYKFLKSKTNHLSFSYWLVDQCISDVHEHCETIYKKVMSEGKKPSSSVRSSFLKTFNSYIPRSKDNWLYHELKKISQLIGFQIQLNKEINEQQYLAGSYLNAIQQDTKGSQIPNVVFQKLIKDDNEEILFYYLKLVSSLKVPLQKQGIDIQDDNETIVELLGILNKVTSLSVLKNFYSLVLQNEIHINENRSLKTKRIFEHVFEKLIYFILTQGWVTFMNRTKISFVMTQDQQFSPDIFRDLECDIVFFVALRHILGIKNFDCIRDNRQFQRRDIRCTETKANCFFVSQKEDRTLIEEPIQVILDGQYIRMIDQNGKSIISEDILIHRCYISESEDSNMLEIIQNEKSESPSQQYYCLAFAQEPIKNYIEKEIKFRCENIQNLKFKLKYMFFQFAQ